MIVLGFAPVVYLGLKDVGGWDAMTTSSNGGPTNPAALELKRTGNIFAPNAWTSAWKPLLAGPTSNPMGVDLFAMVFGLGFVLSFGYWCTNFLVVQRAMAARNMSAARRTPLIAAVPKMLFPRAGDSARHDRRRARPISNKGYRVPPPAMRRARFEARSRR